jgi:serine/threonine-protein kinase
VEPLAEVSLEPGFRLDRYELLCKIGQGGMASVWLARVGGKHVERLVAVKTVLPEHANDAGFRSMLFDEARIAAAIDHPNVARILDVGEDAQTPYLVFEYVAGESLNLLQRTLSAEGRRIPPSIVLRVLADVCAGLHVAHELCDPDGNNLGIVHRDVSPQNILVNDHGIAKLIDFGVAKAAGRLAGETATGIIKGKVPYMAPEQALSLPVDRRADIWSVGSVAYYLLSGSYPFDAPNDAARLIRAVSDEAPPPLPPEIPQPVSEVVLRALSRNPRDRQATAAELRAALEDAAVRSGLVATHEDVARCFAENLKSQIDARKKMISRLSSGSISRDSLRSLGQLKTGDRSEARALLSDDKSAGTIAATVSLAGAGGESKSLRSRLLFAALGGLTVALLVIGAFKLGSSTAARKSPSPMPVAAAAPEPSTVLGESAAAAFTEEEPITIELPAMSAARASAQSSPSVTPPKRGAKPAGSAKHAAPARSSKSSSSDDTIF